MPVIKNEPISTNVLTASIVIAPVNPNRVGFFIYNNSANTVYITLGPTSAGATPTFHIPTFNYVRVDPNKYCYTGVISAIRNTGSGQVTVSEFVPA